MTFTEATQRVEDFIELNYIKAISKILSYDIKQNKASLITSQDMIEAYLQTKGYIKNTVNKQDLFTKGFTVIYTNDFEKNKTIEIWHDKTENTNHFIIHESVLTGLPIALSYMERI